MHEQPHIVPSVHRPADVRESPQQLDVIQDGVSEPFGGGRKIGPGIGQNFLKIR
jgi:hypothetical protein